MDSSNQEIATLAGGCFWCLAAIFKELQGVTQVVSGYSGGDTPNPSYQQVCTGATGHAEVVQITFNPTIISFKETLEVFFSIHDPTTLNRQGHDEGTQYRSAIFFANPGQKNTALEVVSDLEKAGIWDGPFVTEISPFVAFYPGEEYHQNYYDQISDHPYSQVIITPKLAKFRKAYISRLKDKSTATKA